MDSGPPVRAHPATPRINPHPLVPELPHACTLPAAHHWRDSRSRCRLQACLPRQGSPSAASTLQAHAHPISLAAGQSIVHFAHGYHDEVDYAIKFFLDQDAFLAEAALYASYSPASISHMIASPPVTQSPPTAAPVKPTQLAQGNCLLGQCVSCPRWTKCVTARRETSWTPGGGRCLRVS